MNLRDFRRAGHWPTLLSAFLYFDVSFMIWVLIGALANAVANQLDLSPGEKGVLVAVPILGGAVLRLVLGVMADHFGPRRVGILGMILTMAPLFLGWLWADSFSELLLVGALLGVAGASFAVAIPLASRWYPPRYQGIALGIAGAGNSGTALATFFAPRLAQLFGWNAVFGFALIPLLVVFVFYVVCAKDSPTQPPPRPILDYGRLMGKRDTWWFCLFYGVTFGGFVGLASFLNVFFRDQYGLSPIQAGNFATLCVIAGSFLRPVGGYVADRIGGLQFMQILYACIALTMLGMAALPVELAAIAILFTAMGLLGMGNGAVFQLVPQRFPKEVGVISGVVGAAGGVGGFLLPTLLGGIKQTSGSFSGGFVTLGVVCLATTLATFYVVRIWGSGRVRTTPNVPSPAVNISEMVGAVN